jgi:hypothetical protein
VKKFLFLDVDGVLHPFHGQHVPENKVETFHRDCMNRLCRIVEETDCEIVLSSSWRNFLSTRNRLFANLSGYGLTFTSWIEPDSPGTKSASAGKLSRILSFVQVHHPQEWAVLDDEDLVLLSGADPISTMVQSFSSRFIRTDPAMGLTDSDVTRTISLLNDTD